MGRPMIIESVYLTTEQAATYLGVSETLILREFKAGRLAGFRPAKRVVRFTREDLDAWMTKGRVETDAHRRVNNGYVMGPTRGRRRSVAGVTEASARASV